MTIQELREFFDQSDYSDETKGAIADVLKDKTENNQTVIFAIHEILQKELDADFAQFGASMKDDPEGEKIEADYKESLTALEKDLDNDLAFVEKELKDLDSSV